MSKSESIAALAGALAKAQGKIMGAKKDSLNPHFKTKYANLASVWEACRAPLSENGLSVVQTVGDLGTGLSITTTLLHSSGEWIEGYSVFPVSGDIQKYGSVITYARRFTLAALVGVAPDDDDDGNSVVRQEPDGTKGAVAVFSAAISDASSRGELVDVGTSISKALENGFINKQWAAKLREMYAHKEASL